ncbi:MAG: TAXI family TRAP transporter solute-binding subunit [Gammaproteobacteria bacterium]|nr:TAXI family TRAP transporter solute-binding subunit [Gammaproteobacteria bacterium]NIR83140.1 TAXI family TRAP transporter solute-binding subunit [Gammaproteobacteria bacterium]NIR90948.1 TAXI family TRAP transporter solute-binding subunit [Gammaproteobacteria bacterium]NIU04305.1 TAXI family TRAP transporter solute-binding subunit [Gammaproteobacteria bacterium]NIV52528.1 TAXI family TRAP transporter solute-binding subunit [Gammaproteobacteria bacterium]
MRTFLSAVLGAALVAAPTGRVAADTVAIGTLPQGSLGYAIASAVAKVATEHSSLQVRAVGLGGSNVFIPQVNNGEIEFSTSNTVEVGYAYGGTGNFEGRSHRDVRMVAALVPFRVGIMVRKDSEYQSLRDLAGRPFPTDYTSQKLVEAFLEAMVRTVDMEVDDFRRVPVPNFVKGVGLLTTGEVEGALLAPGSSIVKKADAEVGVRFLSLPNTPEAEKALQAVAPNAYLAEVKPHPKLTGIVAPVTLMGYEYTLIAGKDVPDEAVYELVKAVHQNQKALAAAHGIYNRFDPARMALEVGVPYHPGAEKYYREVGIWPPKAPKI